MRWRCSSAWWAPFCCAFRRIVEVADGASGQRSAAPGPQAPELPAHWPVHALPQPSPACPPRCRRIAAPAVARRTRATAPASWWPSPTSSSGQAGGGGWSISGAARKLWGQGACMHMHPHKQRHDRTGLASPAARTRRWARRFAPEAGGAHACADAVAPRAPPLQRGGVRGRRGAAATGRLRHWAGVHAQGVCLVFFCFGGGDWMAHGSRALGAAGWGGGWCRLCPLPPAPRPAGAA